MNPCPWASLAFAVPFSVAFLMEQAQSDRCSCRATGLLVNTTYVLGHMTQEVKLPSFINDHIGVDLILSIWERFTVSS